ncbi:hypothetical protein V6N11_076490 [Hibiscus sabdariffa]|uniref:Uncharacterized protein n=1 Tax=Hibiscus sabdariffa TaxID=183260 RepID=A0ABR2Q6E8_9ROSI
MNELDRVDAAVSNLLLQGSEEEQKLLSALLNLESLDAVFESFEEGLEFERLINHTDMQSKTSHLWDIMYSSYRGCLTSDIAGTAFAHTFSSSLPIDRGGTVCDRTS